MSAYDVVVVGAGPAVLTAGALLASEGRRGIGIDRAARAALTTVEDYLGRRIRGLGDTWRYSAFTA